jgi:hypothetical protein
VGPSELENRLILLWIERVAGRIDLRWDRSEQVRGKLDPPLVRRLHSSWQITHHANDLWVYLLGNDPALLRNVFEHLMKRLCLDLLAVEVATGIVEIKDHSTLLELLDEQLVAIFGSNIFTV